MSKKKQQRNGFFYYMLDMQQELKQQGKSISMRDMPIFAGPSWSKLSDAQKQMYNLRAKSDKARGSGGGGATVVSNPLPAMDSIAPGRRDCSGKLIAGRVDVEGEMLERRERESMEIRAMLPPGCRVTLECFWVMDIQTLCHIPHKPEHKYLPCEIGVLCYSLNQGILSKFHRFIQPGSIPVGYRFLAQSTSESTNLIPVEGAPDAMGDYRKLLGELEQYLTNDGQSHILPPIFAKRNFVDRVEWSLGWLANNAGVTNRITRVYALEDLVRALIEHSEAGKVISPFVVEEMLKTSNYDHDTDTRCSFHENLDCAHCSLGISHTYCFVMSELLCQRYNVSITRNHLSILPPVKGAVVIPPRAHVGGGGSRGPGRSRSATPMHEEVRGRGLGRGLGRGVVSAELRYPPSVLGRGQASLQFS